MVASAVDSWEESFSYELTFVTLLLLCDTILSLMNSLRQQLLIPFHAQDHGLPCHDVAFDVTAVKLQPTECPLLFLRFAAEAGAGRRQLQELFSALPPTNVSSTVHRL